MADVVRLDIQIDALAAIRQLQAMAKGAESSEEAVAKFSNFLLQQSKRWNLSLQQTRSLFQSIDSLLRKQTGAGVFDAFKGGSAGIFKASDAYLQAGFAAKRFTVDNNGVVRSVNQTAEAMEKANRSSGRWRHGIDLVRTALGTLAAVGIFQFLNALQGLFRDFIANLRETELAIYNLVNAERKLSELGIDITPKELQEIIDSVRELVPILSQVDAEELVSKIASNVAPSVKLGREEMEKFAKAVALAYVQNKALGYSLDEVEKSFTDAINTGKVSQGINKYGVKIDELIIKQHAVKMGLVESEEAFSSLTGEMQAQVQAAALVDYAYQEFSKNAQSIPEYMKTADAAIEDVKKTWSDLLTLLGKAFGPVIAKSMNVIANALKVIIVILEAGLPLLQMWSAGIVAIIETMKNLPQYWEILGGQGWKGVWEAFKANFLEAQQLFKDLGDAADTPTNNLNDLQDAADSLDMSKARDELQELLKDLEKLGERIAKEERDFQTKLERFDADTLTDRLRLIEDYNLNVQQTMRQFALRREELEERYRRRQLESEAQFQEQLRQLREKFLYNLEDALRERDARQVLRLIDQYNMEKQAMINEHALQQQQAEAQHQEELEDLREQEAERLRVLAEEHAIRLQRQEEDAALRRQRMLEDHAQEIADLEAQRQQILQLAAEKIAEEYGLNEQGVRDIYDLLSKYYGQDGILERLVAEGYLGMLEQSQGFLSQLQQVIAYQQQLMAQAASFGGYYPAYGSIGGGLGGGGNTQPLNQGTTGSHETGRTRRNFATGGQFVATRPTSINVGEGMIPELVSVIPLSKILGGALDVNGSAGANGLNGEIRIAVDLSPGLEGRIVQRAMEGTAEVVSRVNRSK